MALYHHQNMNHVICNLPISPGRLFAPLPGDVNNNNIHQNMNYIIISPGRLFAPLPGYLLRPLATWRVHRHAPARVPTPLRHTLRSSDVAPLRSPGAAAPRHVARGLRTCIHFVAAMSAPQSSYGYCIILVHQEVHQPLIICDTAVRSSG